MRGGNAFGLRAPDFGVYDLVEDRHGHPYGNDSGKPLFQGPRIYAGFTMVLDSRCKALE